MIKVKFLGQDISLPSGNSDIGTLSGAQLDEWAKKWGLIRRYNESDSQLDHRIRSSAVNDGFGNIELPEGFVDVDKIELEAAGIKPYSGPKCECGVASLGYTQPGPGHADYCPLATK